MMMNSRIKKAYNYIIRKCENPKVGYSQQYRGAQVVNGIQYFDCSSLIYYALKHAGFTTDDLGTYPFTTYTMRAKLEPLGFKVLDAKAAKWKKGDILLRTDHTEMVYKGFYTMGAHTSHRILSDQVSINTLKSSPNNWTYILRYKPFR